MNDLIVEKLLRQMSLKKPSAELDDRVDLLLKKVVSKTAVSSRSSRVWIPILVTAAVSLLIGLYIGTSSSASAMTSAGIAADGQQTDSAQIAGDDLHVRHADLSTELRMKRLQEDIVQLRLLLQELRSAVSSDQQRAQKQNKTGDVAWNLPAGHAVEFHVREAENQDCLQCHSSLIVPPASGFGQWHVGHQEFQVCLSCHQMLDRSALDSISALQ